MTDRPSPADAPYAGSPGDGSPDDGSPHGGSPDDEIRAWAALEAAPASPPDPARPPYPDATLGTTGPAAPPLSPGAYRGDDGRAYRAGPGQDESEQAVQGHAFEEGASDARYEPVGINRRLVLGTALAFVALVLLGLMLATGGDGRTETGAAGGPLREAAAPEFIDRPPASEEAPAFADPDPFAYEPPPDPYAPAAYGPAYGPAYESDYGAYAVPNNAPAPTAGPPPQRPGTPERLGGGRADPREDRYLRARTSPLMVDGSAGALGAGRQGAHGASAGASAGTGGVPGLSPSQQAAYDALDPETRAAYHEALSLAAVFGVDPAAGPAAGPGPAGPPDGGTGRTWAGSPAGAAPSGRPVERSATISVPRSEAASVALGEPGPASRAAFLRRAQETGVQEPFRVRISERSSRGRPAGPRVHYSPAGGLEPAGRGPSASDAEVFGAAPPGVPTPSGLTLLPGTVVPAVLITGMNSELPGDVVAQVERDVFDSATLRHVLIPKGTRLVGTYDDQIAVGQNRALVAWTTMVFPDGRTVALPGLPGVDLQGGVGLQDRVDRHLGRVFGAAVAIAAVGTGLALAAPARDGLDLSPQTVASAQVAIELSRVATEVLRRELGVQPTVRIRPGYRLLVFVARAMEFDAPYVSAPDPGRFRRFSREPPRGQPYERPQ